MRKAIALFFFVFCFAHIQLAVAQAPAERPAWSAGLAGWGVLDVPTATGKTDLERLSWKPGFLIAQDRHDEIYILDASSGAVHEYTRRGDEHGSWHVDGWQPLHVITALAGFAANRHGDVFAVASREKVRIFDRDEVLAEATLPTFVTGLAFAGNDLLAARLPVEFQHPKTQKPGPPRMKSSFLVSRLDLEGKTLSESVRPEPVKGGDIFSLALTQAAQIAVDQQSRDGAVWLADRFRSYRLRRLSRSGTLEAEWHDKDIQGKVAFAGPVPEGVKQTFTKEAAATYQPIDAQVTVRDLTVRDGLVFVLLEPGLVAKMPMIDVVADASMGPLWRLALRTSGAGYYGRLLVTDSDFWLFPVAAGAHPTMVERVPDDVIRQSLEATRSENGGGGSQNQEDDPPTY